MTEQADERDQTTKTTPAEQADHGQPQVRSGATAARPGDVTAERERSDTDAAERDRDERDEDPLETRAGTDPDVRETASGEDTDEEATTHSESTKDAEQEAREEEERHRAAEEFSAEHDPAKHDLTAGEDFRQRGDWTADKAGEPQVWDADGNLVDGSEYDGTLSTGDVAKSDGATGAGHSDEHGADQDR